MWSSSIGCRTISLGAGHPVETFLRTRIRSPPVQPGSVGQVVAVGGGNGPLGLGQRPLAAASRASRTGVDNRLRASQARHGLAAWQPAATAGQTAQIARAHPPRATTSRPKPQAQAEGGSCCRAMSAGLRRDSHSSRARPRQQFSFCLERGDSCPLGSTTGPPSGQECPRSEPQRELLRP